MLGLLLGGLPNQRLRLVRSRTRPRLCQAIDRTWTGNYEIVLVEVHESGIVYVYRHLVGEERSQAGPPAKFNIYVLKCTGGGNSL